MKKLELDFYGRENVLQIAEELMGKLLVTNKAGIITSGRIVECEAYAGAPDKASHAFGGMKLCMEKLEWLMFISVMEFITCSM
jgi:DNA-3-methyladenine glycosylase